MEAAIKQTRAKKSNKEGSITKRKDGTWTARLQVGTKLDGKPMIKAFYGKTESEVKKKLNAFKKQILISGVDTSKRITVAEYIRNWLEVYKFKALKPPSYDRLESTINTHIIPELGFFQLGNIPPETIQRMLNNKSEEYSFSSVKKIYNALDECFNHAVDNDKLIKNPMRVVNMPSYDNFVIKDKEMVIFTDDEIDRFTAEATRTHSNGKYVYKNGIAFIFALNTGIRIGELLGLETDAFNFTTNTVNIKQNLARQIDRSKDARTKNKIVLQDSTKTRSGFRSVPLNETALKVTEILLNMYRSRRVGNNFFLVSRNKTPIRYRNVLNTYDCILQKAGIGHCGLHTLRHSYVKPTLRKFL